MGVLPMNRYRKKRMIIAGTWLLFVVGSILLLLAVENGLCRSKAREKLLEQASVLESQLPGIAENQLYYQTGSSFMASAKLKALTYALEDCSDLDGVRNFIDDFAADAGIEGLVAYDREGKAVYGDGSLYSAELDAEAVNYILDGKAYELIQDSPISVDITADIADLFFWLNYDEAGYYYWGVNDRWLFVMKNTMSSTQQEVSDYFNWKNVLAKKVIGNNGGVIAFSPQTETVVSSRYPSLVDRNIGDLGIVADGKNAADYRELVSLFPENNTVIRMTIGGADYFAVRFGPKASLFLAVIPVSDVWAGMRDSFLALTILIVMTTGLSLFYVILNIGVHGTQEEQVVSGWSRILLGKFKLMAVLSLMAAIGLGIYIESLSSYADTFDYCQTKVDEVVTLLNSNSDEMDKLQKWYDDEYLVRAGIVATVLRHKGMENVDWEYLHGLSEALRLESIYVFDEDGRIRLTDSPYDRIVIDVESPFHVLLEGRASYVEPLTLDGLSGEVLQKAAVALRKPDRSLDGVVMVVNNAEELDTIRRNLGYRSIFEQISLINDSFVMVVDDTDMTIEYLATITDGEYNHSFGTFDYTGMKISVLGIDEQRLRDNYNGNMFVMKNSYFASVRREGSSFFMILRPQAGMDRTNVIPVILIAAFSLAFSCTLLLSSSRRDALSEAFGDKEEKFDPELEGRIEDIRGAVGKMFDRAKPYFEVRWPGESIKWKDKSPAQRFAMLFRYAMLGLLAYVILSAVYAGHDSIWYYCVNGVWDSGINLYSITNCIISICLMFLIKMVIHKILFFIARAANAKGETICSLLDSFSGYVLFIAGIVVCLANFGVSAKAISLTGGALGVVFGIACKNVFDDIFSGIIMTFEGVVHNGDFVWYNGQWGNVERIGIRTTILRWFNDLIIVRNNDFKNFHNVQFNEVGRFKSFLTIDLKESLSRAEEIFNAEIPKIGETLGQMVGCPVKVRYRGVTEINQNGVVLSFVLYCKSMHYFLTRVFNGELKKMCERNGINLAMHQVVVNEPNKYPGDTDED